MDTRYSSTSGGTWYITPSNKPTSLAEHRCAETCLMGAALLLAVTLAFSIRLLQPHVEAAHVVDDVYSRLLSLPASVNGAVKKRGAVPSELWELDQRQATRRRFKDWLVQRMERGGGEDGQQHPPTECAIWVNYNYK